MNHLHVLIPDLFPPQEIAARLCADLRVPALEKVLARSTANTSDSTTLEDWLCHAFAAEGAAPVRAAADGLAVGEAYWLCADPVNLELQHSQVLVQPDVMPTREEATALCANLNEHFAGMGLGFHAPHPRRWYARLDAAPQIVTSPLRQVAWRDAKFHQPQGADALHWQRVTTEMQMLLYAHPANQARAARGELVINSLWLWGGGRAVPLKGSIDAVGGDSALADAFAQVAGAQQAGSLRAMLNGEYESALQVCIAPGEALQRGDLHAWRAAVLRFEQEFAQPLLKALQAGRLQNLTLEVLREEGGRRFDLTSRGAWQVWRSARPLARYAV